MRRRCLGALALAALLGAPAAAARAGIDCAAPATAADRAVCGVGAFPGRSPEQPPAPDRLDPAARAAAAAAERDRITRRVACRPGPPGIGTCPGAAPAPEAAAPAWFDARRGGLRDERTLPSRSPMLVRALWRCAGQALPVATAVAPGPAGRMSVRWGETWLLLPPADAASGARFADPVSGAAFWSEGGAATLTAPGEPPVACRRFDG